MFQPEVARMVHNDESCIFWLFLAIFGSFRAPKQLKKFFFDIGLVFFIFIMADISARNS